MERMIYILRNPLKVIDNSLKQINQIGFVFLISISFFISFSASISAQIGIKVGTTASTFYYSDHLNPKIEYDVDLRPVLGYDIEFVQLGSQKPIISPFLGVYYQFKLSPKLSIQPELCFHQKGVNFNQFEFERIIYQVRISYLEMPLSIACHINQNEKMASDLYFGGYGAIKMNAIKKVATHNEPVEKKKINSVNTFVGGIHIGVNYKRKLFEKFFLIDFRVFLGLSDLFEMPETWTNTYFDLQKTKTAGIHLTLGYVF
jgi:hypothetical protein